MRVKIETGSGSFIIEAEPGARLDDLILSAGILLDRPCGGRGKCGKCAVRAKGALSPVSRAERDLLTDSRIESGYRLACLASAESDCEVQVEAGTVLTDKTFQTGEDPAADLGPLGLAIDLGTTTVGVFLARASDGKVYAGASTLNRQAPVGAEVMSRLAAAEEDPRSLMDMAWDGVIEAASLLGLDEKARLMVRTANLVGNSAMHHLALGLPIQKLVRSPFEPHSVKASEVDAGGLKEMFPSLERVCLPPLIGGFVGSDALACIVYFGLGRGNETALVLDLGTNGEVMLASGGEIMVASTAAGPAFEGVNIEKGVRAVPGAVTGVSISEGALRLDSIGGLEPMGLTGSGLISAVKALRDLGLIDESGALCPDNGGSVSLEEKEGVKRVMLSREVWISQLDVRELQKAKGAVRAAIEILLNKSDKRPADLERVILTGSFGGRLDPRDVLSLGVLPEVRAGVIRSIPNGAGMGAAIMLEPERAREAEITAARALHVELSLDPLFMDRYVSNMRLSP